MYGFTAGSIFVLLTPRRSALRDAAAGATAMVFGLLATLAAYTAVEIVALGVPSRLQRSAATAGSAAESGAGRFESAITTTVSLFHHAHIASQLVGVAFIALALFAIHRRLSDAPNGQLERLVIAMFATSVLLHVLLQRPLSGLFTTVPLAVLGVVAGFHKRSWTILSLGLAPVPLSVPYLTNGLEFGKF